MVLMLDGDNSATAYYRGIERIPNLCKAIHFTEQKVH